MKIHLFVFLILLLPFVLSADIYKITDIRDSNLFELSDGSLVRLANVDVPSVQTTDSSLIQWARFIKKYAENEYRSYPVSVEYSGKKDSAGYPLVHMFQRFPLQTLHINLAYLKKGFGRYTANDSGKYDTAYRTAASYAEINKIGVWNLTPFHYPGFTDYALSVFYGYFKPRDTNYKTSYNEFTARFAPAKEMRGLEARATVFIKQETGRLCCECPGNDYIPPYRTEHSLGFIISGFFHQTFKWAAISMGMNYLNSEDIFCSESSDYFIFPSFAVSAGKMDKIFLSVSVWDSFRLSEYTAGVTYIFSNPFNRLWVGFGSYSGYKKTGFQLDYNFYKNYLLHAQGGYDLKEKPEAYGRIGFGFILH